MLIKNILYCYHTKINMQENCMNDDSIAETRKDAKADKLRCLPLYSKVNFIEHWLNLSQFSLTLEWAYI
jgi:hypothetical protein